MNYFGMFGGDALDTNLWFLHRGVIEPKSGIGAHFHNYCEEMFVILDGEAQFTINGRTSTLKGPAGAPARMRGSPSRARTGVTSRSTTPASREGRIGRIAYRSWRLYGTGSSVIVPGRPPGHEWLTWRRSFKEFAPLLFR